MIKCAGVTYDEFGNLYILKPWQPLNTGIDPFTLGAKGLQGIKFPMVNVSLGILGPLTKKETIASITSPTLSISGGLIGGAGFLFDPTTGKTTGTELGIYSPGIGGVLVQYELVTNLSQLFRAD